MQKLKRQAMKKSRLATISQVKLEKAHNELLSVNELLSKASESVEKAKLNLDTVSQTTREYLQKNNICPVRLNNFHNDISLKTSELQTKENEYQQVLQDKTKLTKDYIDALRINDFWQGRTQLANSEIRNLEQKTLDKALNEIYLNNARVKHD